MRHPFARLVVAAAGVFVILSCDNPPAGPKFGNGISGGPTGTSPVTPPSPGGVDTNKPFVRIDTPATTGQLVNVGDSILVVTRIIDDRALASLVVTGFKFTGNANLGTFAQIVRYGPVGSPAGGPPLPVGLTDTVIRRYLKPVAPVDTSLDSLIIIAVVTDASGNVDTARKRVNIVAGPRVTIEAPIANDSVSQGIAMAVRVHVTHPDGVQSIAVRIQGEATWPASARLDTTVVTNYTGAQRDVTVNLPILIPLTAPERGRVTISATALDVNRNPGSTAPIVVFVRRAGTTIPRVTQVVPPRLETADSVTIFATGDGIAALGIVIYDSVGVQLRRDSVLMTPPFTSNARAEVPIGLGPLDQGRRVTIASFAVDQAGITGYSVRATFGGTQADILSASRDSSLIVFGKTYKLPRDGIIGDIAVDEGRGNVFLSSLQFNRLELWQVATAKFYDPGIAVGSAPWGLARGVFAGAISDTIIVANSGGTNVSKVFIGSTDPTLIREDLTNRVRTRTAPLFEVLEQISNNRITINVSNPILFSNRPQYIGQILNGLVFFSTRPTTEAPKGIVHYFDPSQAFPDLRTIVNYKGAPGNSNYLVLDADSIYVKPALATSGLPDTLVIWDHPPGTTLPSDSVQRVTGVGSAVAGIQAKVGSDIVAIPRVDVGSIGLTDTTFVATSGDRNWIAFGYGNTAAAGNIFMASPGFFSPIFSQTDLTNNAAEHIFGLALDSTGITVGAHGAESYFGSVDVPFHLRLQGKFTTFSHGAGIAFHPSARGTATPVGERLSFVASDDATIQILDVAHYLAAGRLPIKTKLYGPLRVSRRFPSDPPDVVLKLYGVATTGLVVIDVRDVNMSPVP
jgi:hypothetical protein